MDTIDSHKYNILLYNFQQGSHNPKVASSNLATATTNPQSVRVTEFPKNQKINLFLFTPLYTKKSARNIRTVEVLLYKINIKQLLNIFSLCFFEFTFVCCYLHNQGGDKVTTQYIYIIFILKKNDN